MRQLSDLKARLLQHFRGHPNVSRRYSSVCWMRLNGVLGHRLHVYTIWISYSVQTEATAKSIYT
jgi:hypothetical protein